MYILLLSQVEIIFTIFIYKTNLIFNLVMKWKNKIDKLISFMK